MTQSTKGVPIMSQKMLTNEETCRVVAERLGHWKPCVWSQVANGVGLHCDTHDFYNMRKRCSHPCPDYTQPAEAWRLVEALNKAPCLVRTLLQNDNVTYRVEVDGLAGNGNGQATSPSLAQALLDAAYKWVTLS